MLNIRTKTMFGTTHSWAVTMRGLFRQFLQMNHNVYIESTNGDSFVSSDLKNRFLSCDAPDIDICYTLPRNFPFRFKKESSLKLAIYNYESSILPDAWINKINHVDFVLPSSTFSKDIFVKNGWPEDKCIVIPHGINIEDFKNKEKVKNLRNKKKFRFLNISIPHYRKNIDILIDAYYSSFSEKDDVCLVLKTSLKAPNPKHPFECDITKEILKIQKKHSGRMLPQIEILEHKYDDIIALYNSCDCLINTSSSEGFGLPLLEGLAAGMLVVATRCSGQLDFLNDKNSLLIDAKEGYASSKYQYWRASDEAVTFFSDISDVSSAMIKAYTDHKLLLNEFHDETERIINKFTWKNAANKILELK